jgi:hypothetical protein
MKGLRDLFVIGGVAVSLAFPQLAMCADTGDNGAASPDKVKIDETKGHDRGFAFTPLGEVGGAKVPGTAATPAKKVDNKAVTPVKATNAGVARTNQTRRLILTAVQKPKHNNKTAATAAAHPQVKPVGVPATTPATATAVVPSANTSSNMLVKYASENGAIISARLDRTGTMPVYKVGDKMVVKVRASQDCNVVVFNYDSTGTLTQIFPNDYQQDGFVKAGAAVEIGGSDSPFDYQIAGKGGPEKVFVYAYPTGGEGPNPLTAMMRSGKIAMAPIPNTPFRGAEMSVEQYRNMVNQSQVFYSRSVEIKPRNPHNTAQLVSTGTAPGSPNKVELTFNVDK